MKIDPSTLQVGDTVEYSLNNGDSWHKCQIKYVVEGDGVVGLCFLGLGGVYEREQYLIFSQAIFRSAPAKTKVVEVLDQTEDEFVDYAVSKYCGRFHISEWEWLYQQGLRLPVGESND